MIDKLNLIKQTVAKAKDLPNASIEYNLGDLPEHKEVKAGNFFGVPASYDEKRQINTLNVTRKFQ